MKQGGKISTRFDRWVDEWKMALSGVLLATRSWKFDLVVVITFIIFGTVMNLLASSTASLNLFWATDLSGKMSILWDSFLAIFGVGRTFLDWLLLFSITLLQSILIGLVVFVWQKRRQNRRQAKQQNSQNSDNLQSAGLVAGLAILGSGCPTCGTTLLMPVLGAVFSSSSYVLAGVVSGLLTAGAVLLALFSLKRIGRDAYAMIKSEEFTKHRKAKEQNGELREE